MIENVPDWVNQYVRTELSKLEGSAHLYADEERLRWRRLTSDSRMKEVYSSAYLNRMLRTESAWCHWFNSAINFQSFELKYERDQGQHYRKLMKELHEKMEEASSIFEELSELDFSEENHPREMSDVIRLLYEVIRQEECNGNGQLSYKFDSVIKPKLQKVEPYDSRYMPSVSQTIKALSNVLFLENSRLQENGIAYGNHIAREALNRQHAPLSEYVRSFDVQIIEYREIIDSSFCLPPKLLAIQSQVALNLNSVDEKQIHSARKKKIKK